MNAILLIDDNDDLLYELATDVRNLLSTGEAEVKTWAPSKDDDPVDKFNLLIGVNTTLVITDFVLTKKGLTGFFGPSVVEWSQSRLIPVGDFSRGDAGNLPKEPNLFELRVPIERAKAASYIVQVYRGFTEIATLLESNEVWLHLNNSSAILAHILQCPHLESQFSLYGLRLGTMSSVLMSKITATAPKGVPDPGRTVKIQVLTYVLGHLLLNAILKFSGPVLSTAALCAYVGVDRTELKTIQHLFNDAIYNGPFAGLGPYFWLHKVDDILGLLLDELSDDTEAETTGELNRLGIEKRLSAKLTRHDCGRCFGENGGFYCPFTERPVCIREDCSVASNSWIPQGASLCRIEREFYDEWAPILGF